MDNYDIVLKNGQLVDPKNNINKKTDVAIKNGKIKKIDENIDPFLSEKCYDLKNLIITPGLIDAHTHCYYSTGIKNAWAGDYSIQPDYYSFKSGVTTMVDTGSSGSYNFEHFKATVIDRAKTKILAYLNIADYGMSSLMVEQFVDRNDEKQFVNIAKKNSDTIIGIKIAHYELPDWKDVIYAKKMQEQTGLPIMVDFGVFKKERPYPELISHYLDPGDISTHCFRAPVPVLDQNKKVYDYLWKAKERGIKFDLGHGAGSFLFRNAVPALQQQFYPDSLSTDIHGLNIYGTVVDMPTTLSKIKACADISWEKIFELTTWSPAQYLHREHLGHLSIGACADIAVWSVRSGVFGFEDSAGAFLEGNEKLECEMTFKDGKLIWNLNARGIEHYRKLPGNYGLDVNKEDLVTP